MLAELIPVESTVLTKSPGSTGVEYGAQFEKNSHRRQSPGPGTDLHSGTTDDREVNYFYMALGRYRRITGDSLSPFRGESLRLHDFAEKSLSIPRRNLGEASL